MVLRPSVPPAGPRGKEEGENPRAVDQIGARSPGRWGDAVEAPALQSKPVAPASRLVARVAPSVAFGLELKIPAAGPARVRLYSYRGRLCAQPSKAIVRELSDSSARHSSDARPRMLSQLRSLDCPYATAGDASARSPCTRPCRAAGGGTLRPAGLVPGEHER